MRIVWNVRKKRGNCRPVLTYRVELEQFEQDLAVPAVEVQSRIPKPPVTFEAHCWPDENERASGWRPDEWYTLKTPSHKAMELEAECRLPWRENNEYPEVAESFELLRLEYEQALQAAYDSLPMDHADEMSYTPELKRHLAPGVAAGRLLRSRSKK